MTKKKIETKFKQDYINKICTIKLNISTFKIDFASVKHHRDNLGLKFQRCDFYACMNFKYKYSDKTIVDIAKCVDLSMKDIEKYYGYLNKPYKEIIAGFKQSMAEFGITNLEIHKASIVLGHKLDTGNLSRWLSGKSKPKNHNLINIIKCIDFIIK